MKSNAIIIICLLICLTACREQESHRDVPETYEEKTSGNSVGLSPIWEYDYNRDVLVRKANFSSDTVTVQKLITLINHNTKGRVELHFVKHSGDTLFVEIQKPTFLTQQMGTSGAWAYMSTTTYTLTELEDINAVSFDFEEGDHASPGVYGRENFENLIE